MLNILLYRPAACQKLCFALVCCAMLQLSTQAQKTSALPFPLTYVNPFIGTDAHGHTYPGAVAPFGMVQLSPDTRLNGWDGCSGYHYSDSLLYGFSHTHLSGTGVEDYCDLLFAPFTGAVPLESGEYASPFKKSSEKAQPGYYSVFLDKYRVKAEMTSSERVGVHRYTFPLNRERGGLILDLRHRDETLDASLRIVNDREIEGHRVSKAWAKEQHIYFVARFSRPIGNSMAIDMSTNPRVAEKKIRSKAIVGVFQFYHDGEPIEVSVGISGVSIEGARRNLEAECPALPAFDAIKTKTQQKWERQLSKISVEGGTDAQKNTFYTALYHTSIVPNLWSDVDGQYRGRDNQIHRTDGHPVYSVFSLWDTYRACNPLYTLLEPKRTADFIKTFLLQYEQGGLLPIWELSANETDCMIGNHAIPVIADAYLKGIRDFDAPKALEAMVKSTQQDRYGMQWYRTLGYVPADKEPESVSKTLEYAYDDWCVARMAYALGRKDLSDTYIKRAQSYKNLYDPSTGFFRARNNATWYTPFNPYEVNFNYTEANAWQYRLAMPHDIEGLRGLFGAQRSLTNVLDSLFLAQTQTAGRDQADITGLIGQYVQGNEPSHHMAYLYAFDGQPAKTQQRVRQILDNLYSNKPDGLSGNEDCGQMSAWYVFSAMGFYPALPGSGEYILGSPLFEKVSIRLDNGKTVVLQAPGASAQRPYVARSSINGQPSNALFLTHAQLVDGAQVSLEMSDKAPSGPPSAFHVPHSGIALETIVPVPFVAAGTGRVFQTKHPIALGCAQGNAVIRYTLDGQEPTEKSPLYRKPFELNKSATIKAAAWRDDGLRSQTMIATFAKTASGGKAQYHTRFNPQYTAGGEGALLDGVRGEADFRTGTWQGFEGVDMELTIDLGKKRALKKIGTGFLQDENSWIFFPQRLEVEVSTDGKTFLPAGEATPQAEPLAKGILIEDLSVPLPSTLAGQKFRSVRVRGISRHTCPLTHKGEGKPCWVFVDEVWME